MAEDFDVEALLEAPYLSLRKEAVINGIEREKERDKDREKIKKREARSRSRSRSHDREKDKERRREKKREKREKRSRSKDRDRSERVEKRRRSRSKERSKERESRSRRDKERDRSPPRWERERERERWGNGRRHGRSRSRSLPQELTPEERDQRTVFCMQLAARVRTRDLEEFFSAVGKVREVRLIMDNKTRRHKGISYVEFVEISSVPLAIALNGQKLCGVPIVITPTQAEKNRAAASATAVQRGYTGPMRLYVGSLHFNITEDMLRGIFEPFGRIDKIELMRDPETARSKGYGFITFHDAEDAKKALEQLNGFELAGRQMKVNHVTERTDVTGTGSSMLDSDDLDRSGIELGTTGRLQLMAKLAEGTGIQMPQAALNALQMNANSKPAPMTSASQPIATQCFMLSNMFDPNNEPNPGWAEEIRNDVIEECRVHGGALHVFVDAASDGNVYVKCPTVNSASASVSALHGRWFAGRLVTAAYVPVVNYHQLFPDSVNVITTL